MKFERKGMVEWYDLKQLAQTGLKVIISSLFGNYADKREIQASLGDSKYYDYTERNGDGVWVDYIADLGDGFNSTYTLAHLLAQPNLEVDGQATKRGDILVMGGDQVYPTPIKEEYENRLQGPYSAALPKTQKPDESPHLFAIPGNHDWYDGLGQFLKLFCQKRNIGDWRTQQNRSYFAIKLLDDCWLWGIDVQLNADIDKPQLDYFDELDLKPHDKVILCTAEPAWVFPTGKHGNKSQERLNFFKKNYIHCKDLQLVATIAGDLHHYARYTQIREENNGKEEIHLITAGGGGAFMHPTHNLKKEIQLEDQSIHQQAVFPSKDTSKKLASKNLLFPFLSNGNLSFACVFGVFYMLQAWIIQSHTTLNEKTYMDILSKCAFHYEGFSTMVDTTFHTIIHIPSIIILNIIFLYALFSLTNSNPGDRKRNYIIGGIHITLHFLLLYGAIWAFSRINIHYAELEVVSIRQVVLFAFEMLAVGAIIGGIIFGFYLFICNRFYDMHDNEAFSSLQWEHHKNFLRIHFTKEKITIYPIGIPQIINTWNKDKTKSTKEQPKYSSNDEPKLCLIEKPIIIENKI